jgi:branched-chain amino acid transport system permease protein
MAQRISDAWWSPAVNLVGLLLIGCGVTSALAMPSLNLAVSELLIYIVAVVGLQIFIGNSGIISFGHVTFMLIAAYASAWQTCPPAMKALFMPGLPRFLLNSSIPVIIAAVLSGAVAAVFAAATGAVLMRLSGVAASIALFALLATVRSIYLNWDSWTGGASSIIGLPLYVTVPIATAWACIAIIVAVVFRESRFGLVLRASMDERIAAEASGANVYLLRLFAMIVSAFFVGISGVLMGHYLGTLAVSNFWLDTTFLTLAMLVIGGMSSVSGAVVGCLVVRLVIEVLRQLEQGVSVAGFVVSIPEGSQEVALAIAMILFLIYRPSGLMVGRELHWPIRRITLTRNGLRWRTSQGKTDESRRGRDSFDIH